MGKFYKQWHKNGKENPHFYAVRKGRKKGIFNTWEECEASTKGYRHNEFKGFLCLDEAYSYLYYGKPPKNIKGPMDKFLKKKDDVILTKKDIQTINKLLK